MASFSVFISIFYYLNSFHSNLLEVLTRVIGSILGQVFRVGSKLGFVHQFLHNWEFIFKSGQWYSVTRSSAYQVVESIMNSSRRSYAKSVVIWFVILLSFLIIFNDYAFPDTIIYRYVYN